MTCASEGGLGLIMTPYTANYLVEPLIKLGNGEYCGKNSTFGTILNRSVTLVGLIPLAALQVVEIVVKFVLGALSFLFILPFEAMFSNKHIETFTFMEFFTGGCIASVTLLETIKKMGSVFTPGPITE